MIYCSLCSQPLDFHDEWEVSYVVCEPCHNLAISDRRREDQEGYDHWMETEKKRLQTLLDCGTHLPIPDGINQVVEIPFQTSRISSY